MFSEKVFFSSFPSPLTWINQRLSWQGHSLDVEIFVEEIGTVISTIILKTQTYSNKIFYEKT